MPASTLIGSIVLAGRNTEAKANIIAESMLRKAAAAAHRPAQILLCGSYLRGRFGFAKRILGLVLLPAALIQFAVAAKFQVFSVSCFHYSHRSTEPLFASRPLRRHRF